MPDPSLSQAIKEAYASAPADVIVYHTLELWHSAFTQPIRVVRDDADLVATLESTAPRNSAQPVTFVAFAFEFSRPEVTSDGVPQVVLEIDNVSREILAAVEAAVGHADPIEVIYREFISSDLSAPQNDPPLTLTILGITADVFRVRATAGFTNLTNKRFPAQDYSADRFPGLVL
jgi:hypothetical protein